jgi:cell division protein FtsB
MRKTLVGVAAIVVGLSLIGMGIAQYMDRREREVRLQAQQERTKQLQSQLDQLKLQIDQLKAQSKNAPAPK